MRYLKQIFSEKILLVFLLLTSVALNLYYAYQVMETRHVLNVYRETRRLSLGEPAPRLIAQAATGAEVNFDFADKPLPTVLYLKSKRCHWCEENNKNVDEMIAQAGGRYNLIVLTMEDPQSDQPIIPETPNVLYLYKPTLESRIGLELASTPATLYVSPDGKLQKIWKGAYTGQLEIEIEKELGINLPGLREEKAAL